MEQLLKSIPPALFAAALAFAAWVALDLGRRWIAYRDRTRLVHERLDAVEQRTRETLETYDQAIVNVGRAVGKLEERTLDLEQQNETNRTAGQYGRRVVNTGA